ncbi:heptaprenyl diphosphate synthase component 1 [Bacillus alkalicellulosilyticus]|uniref:heptaprenyl diphosphate synthase component 1 n=1 Tax=Alkalihalobacterium alkalicellulosilyticum TaxID=1912214 RepID=UPI000996773A|nr:heptaprenyl diphosphate synthase component 1 [Bacillus alkalicellulosilyticus]
MNNRMNDFITDCVETFSSMIEHPFLQQYIQEPIVDEDKLAFMFAMLSERLSEKELKPFALSVILVDAALTTHELVSLQKCNSEAEKKNRQLTVLAGDFYSSLYYQLLSSTGNVLMIRIFSYSIQVINEHKMNLYQSDMLSYDSAKENLRNIESVLLQNIAEHFALSEWKQLLSEYFLLKRLELEYRKWSSGQSTPVIQALYHQKGTLEMMSSILDECIAKIEGMVETNDHLKSFMIERLSHGIPSYRLKEKVTGEG